MSQTLNQNNRTTISLERGKVLSVTADSVSSARVVRKPASLQHESAVDVRVLTGETNVFGPYNASQIITLECLTGVISYSKDFASPGNEGFFDYNDATTAITPVTLLAGVETPLTNDGAGAFSNRKYKPEDVSDIWDVSSNSFDFSELSLGDELMMRMDVSLTTAAVNTDLSLGLQLGVGGSPYDLVFLQEKPFKVASAHPNEIVTAHVYIGDENTLNNPAKVMATVDKDATIIVNGWYVRIN